MISLTDSEFLEISRYIKTHYGVNLEKKRALIEGRLSNYISTLGYSNFNDYFRDALNDKSGKELSCMIDRITTNHTFFMREEEHFFLLRDKILPWIDRILNEKDMRIWSAGCSSGEEPYVLSMYILDYIKNNPGHWDSSILATDISTKALLTGQKGIYPTEDINSISEEWKKEYFTPCGAGFHKVSAKLRKNVVFRTLNLLDNFEIKKPFHAIFCRNVMIYFDNETKEELINKFYNALCDGGYLIIGHSESLSSIHNSFDYVSPSVYRK